eukprot:7763759-Ditylum_brightwellii.AAC.1
MPAAAVKAANEGDNKGTQEQNNPSSEKPDAAIDTAHDNNTPVAAAKAANEGDDKGTQEQNNPSSEKADAAIDTL